MTVTVKTKEQLLVPPSVQRQAGIKSGDRVEFRVSRHTITITPVEPTYKPTKAEWAAIRRGEAALARGESVTLTKFLDALDSHRRKAGPKGGRKISR